MSGSDRTGEKQSTDDLLFICPFTKVQMHPIRCRQRHLPILEFIIIFTILPDADTNSVAVLEFAGLSAPYLWPAWALAFAFVAVVLPGVRTYWKERQ